MKQDICWVYYNRAPTKTDGWGGHIWSYTNSISVLEQNYISLLVNLKTVILCTVNGVHRLMRAVLTCGSYHMVFIVFLIVIMNLYSNDEMGQTWATKNVYASSVQWKQSSPLHYNISHLKPKVRPLILKYLKTPHNNWVFLMKSQLMCSSACSTVNAVHWTPGRARSLIRTDVWGKWKQWGAIQPGHLFGLIGVCIIILWLCVYLDILQPPPPPSVPPSMHTIVYPINSFTITYFLCHLETKTKQPKEVKKGIVFPFQKNKTKHTVCFLCVSQEPH